MSLSHFHSKIPVHIKHPNREAYSTPLTIQISTKQKQKQAIISNARNVLQKDYGGVTMNQKCLEVCLTDENDLFFLYYLQLTEEEFTHLKAQLNLCIEYNHFHQHLIEMLQLCIQCQNSENPEYAIYFEIEGTDAQFSVVQKTQFRKLTHLPLYFKSGNDQQLKEYLAGEIKSFKTQNEELKYELEHVKDTDTRSIQRLEEQNRDITQKYDALQRDYSQNMSDLKMTHTQEMTDVKERHLQAVQDLQSKFEMDRQRAEENYTRELKSMTLKNEELTVQNNSLSTEKFKLESRVRELESKLDTLKQEHDSNLKELIELRGQNKSLDTIKFTNEKNLSKNQMELIALKQQIKDKDIHLENLQKLQESATEQKNLLTSEVETLKNALKSTSDKYKQAVNEIRKGNDIIQRLQIQIKQDKYKSKRKKQLIQQMDNKIKSLEQDKIHMEHQINNLKNTEKNLQDDIGNLKGQVEAKQQDIKSQLETIKRLQMVTDSLSHKLNDSHARGAPGMYKRGTTFTSGIGASFVGSAGGMSTIGGSGAPFDRIHTPQPISSMNSTTLNGAGGDVTGANLSMMDAPSSATARQYVYKSSIMRDSSVLPSAGTRPPIAQTGGAPTNMSSLKSGYQRIPPTVPGTQISYTATVSGNESIVRNSPQKMAPMDTSTTAGSTYQPRTTSTSNFVSFNPATLNSSKFHE